MLQCYNNETNKKLIPIIPIINTEFSEWAKKQNDFIRNCLQADTFKADPGTRCLIKDAQGNLQQVFFGIENAEDFWSFVHLPRLLPTGVFSIESEADKSLLELIALAWGLGSYVFKPYKKQYPLPPILAQLKIPTGLDNALIENWIRTIFFVRDLVNTPAEDLTPAELGDAAENLAKEFSGKVKQIIGEDLLKANYPAIYTVGKGSTHEPRLIDLRWGNSKHPKITLVGKGVCFDTGGLDLKPADGMLLMKKDMAGAAHALGLARMIMQNKLPVNLRVLIPAVENSISAEAYRPGDIITTRKGITVEVTNTDAEGRLVLCDALAEACTEKPAVIFDFATLTGAAHIALGPDIPAFYTPQDELAAQLTHCASKCRDPLWRMPLYQPYRFYLMSQVADLTNSGLTRYAGSITAALFLQEFVDKKIKWVHFDFMAWNPENRLGRQMGAEVMILRAVFNYLQMQFGESSLHSK